MGFSGGIATTTWHYYTYFLGPVTTPQNAGRGLVITLDFPDSRTTTNP